MSAYRDRLMSVGFLSRGPTGSRVSEERDADGSRRKRVTDELNNTVTEHTKPGTAVSHRQDVELRPELVRWPE
jgi:hypothetical protein